jgi:hypothetical protein
MFENIFVIPRAYYILADLIDKNTKFNNDISLYNFLIGRCKIKYFTDLYKHLIDDKLINKQNKELLFKKLCYLKRIYICIHKCGFKYKKFTFYNNYDLMLQDFYPTDNVIIVKEGKSFFKFRLYEIITIIENALLQTEYDELRSVMPKNPYTNLPFTNTTLYNIFFYQRYSWFKISHIFYLFYKDNFNLLCFINNNYHYLLDINNGRKVNQLTTYQYIEQVNNMFKLFNEKEKLKIKIPYDFPINILKRHFNKYLKTFYMIKNSKNNSQFYNNILLIKSIFLINQINPLYARKIYKLSYKHKHKHPTNVSPFHKEYMFKIMKKKTFITKLLKPSFKEIENLKILVTIPDPLTNVINSLINPNSTQENQNILFGNILPTNNDTAMNTDAETTLNIGENPYDNLEQPSSNASIIPSNNYLF